jgi:hypothetical protein
VVEDAGAGTGPVASDSITSLLATARDGDRDAADRLYRAVFGLPRTIGGRRFARK